MYDLSLEATDWRRDTSIFQSDSLTSWFFRYQSEKKKTREPLISDSKNRGRFHPAISCVDQIAGER